ncbi:peptidase [Flindersiella endophytica]
MHMGKSGRSGRYGRLGGAVLAGIALVMASAATTTSAQAAPGPAKRDAATSSSAQQSVSAYWTSDRMRSAIPMERLVSRKSVERANVAAGEPSVIEGTASKLLGGVTPQAFPESGGPWTGAGAVTKTAGRVFFVFNGQNASCSGDAVTSTNKSVVVTAGHCVKYQGTWHTNWVFVPGYDNGSRPFGTWTAKATLTTPQWQASEDLNYDVGVGVVNQLNGQSLTDVVGAQGIAFNQARNQSMYTFGYPAADPYDGTKLIYCSGSTFTDFLLSTDHGMACDMTGGSSGGPWFLRFSESSGTGVQASVNSFGYNFLPGYMFGPYFGADAQNLYNRAQAS